MLEQFAVFEGTEMSLSVADVYSKQHVQEVSPIGRGRNCGPRDAENLTADRRLNRRPAHDGAADLGEARVVDGQQLAVDLLGRDAHKEGRRGEDVAVAAGAHAGVRGQHRRQAKLKTERRVAPVVALGGLVVDARDAGGGQQERAAGRERVPEIQQRRGLVFEVVQRLGADDAVVGPSRQRTGFAEVGDACGFGVFAVDVDHIDLADPAGAETADVLGRAHLHRAAADRIGVVGQKPLDEEAVDGQAAIPAEAVAERFATLQRAPTDPPSRRVSDDDLGERLDSLSGGSCDHQRYANQGLLHPRLTSV